MWWLIGFIAYLTAAGVVGIWYGRSEIKDMIANPETNRWEESTEYRGKRRERTEVERIQRCAEQQFWSAFWTGIVWPLYLSVGFVFVIHSIGTSILAGSALRDARKKDADKKTKAILDAYEKEQKAKFKELE